jgi:hypothetical protein
MNYIKSIDDNKDKIINRVNIEYLQSKHNAKLRNKIEIYDKILNRLYNRIEISSDYNQNFCFFHIPEYIYGFPVYNIKSCAAFLIKKLLGNGLQVRFFHPNVIYIYWNYNSSINCISPLMSVPFTPELTYPDSFPNEPRQTALHVLNNQPTEPNTLVDIPMTNDKSKRTINIPLPPINFQNCNSEDVRSILPPHKSNSSYQSIVDVPIREIDIKDNSFHPHNNTSNNRYNTGNQYNPSNRYNSSNQYNTGSSNNEYNSNNYNNYNNSNNNFGISLSEKAPVKKRVQKSYRPINESEPMTKFLYNN